MAVYGCSGNSLCGRKFSVTTAETIEVCRSEPNRKNQLNQTQKLDKIAWKNDYSQPKKNLKN